MKLKTRLIDSPFYVAIVHESDANQIGLHKMGQILVENPKTNKTLSMYALSSTNMSQPGVVSISEMYADEIEIESGGAVDISIAPPSKAVSSIRKKVAGEKLTRVDFAAIIADVLSYSMSPLEVAEFITAVETRGMDMDEMGALALEMLAASEHITFTQKPVVDHHSIGGVPGNKITLIVVPIIAAAGLLIPKTSSRAITGAAGTADLMEALAPVNFSSHEVRKMTMEAGGVIVSGEKTNLIPVDDALIMYENHLNLNPYGIMLSAILTKKKATGADLCIIDIPVGAGTKMKTLAEGKRIANDLVELGKRIDLDVKCVMTYGGNPIGKTIGVNLEVAESLRVLENKECDTILYRKACSVAGCALECAGKASEGKGIEAAEELIKSGKALAKMKDIIKIQGGNPEVTSESFKPGKFKLVVCSPYGGRVTQMNNRVLVRIAKLAGSPSDHGAGILFHKMPGDRTEESEPLYTIYADNEAKLTQAVEYARVNKPMEINQIVLDYVM